MVRHRRGQRAAFIGTSSGGGTVEVDGPVSNFQAAAEGRASTELGKGGRRMTQQNRHIAARHIDRLMRQSDDRRRPAF